MYVEGCFVVHILVNCIVVVEVEDLDSVEQGE
jgi:hypothetical protein